MTRFKFFQALIEGIGGIDIDNPRFFSDQNLKPRGFAAGRVHLNGYSAMVFARIRYGLASGDFDRSANQARVLRGIQRKVRARAADPGFIERGSSR